MSAMDERLSRLAAVLESAKNEASGLVGEASDTFTAREVRCQLKAIHAAWRSIEAAIVAIEAAQSLVPVGANGNGGAR